MLKKMIVPMMIVTLSAGALFGCKAMGEATGETAQKAEEGADDFKEGYNKGKTD